VVVVVVVVVLVVVGAEALRSLTSEEKNGVSESYGLGIVPLVMYI
jgi:Sec-independent protein translocase protein TatA